MTSAGVGQPNAFSAAIGWIEALLMGPLATSLAVVAVAWVGFLMLSGRVNLRRAAMVIIGCFILFGAGTLARGLRGASAAALPHEGAAVEPFPTPPPSLIELSERPPDTAVGQDDPYAGASLRR